MPTMKTRSLDRKLSAIRDGNYQPTDFIIADAKDADMAFGVMAPGRSRTREDYLQDMRDHIASGYLDIMLTSASNGERLANSGALDDNITLAVRANDSTDIWNQRGSTIPQHASLPFRTLHMPEVRSFCDLVLYSITLNNDAVLDRESLLAFKEFRINAQDIDMRYFLEVFNPNLPGSVSAGDLGGFVNDSIVRMLAGVTSATRPLFLKVAYNGGAALTELVSHDPSLVVGILGGSAGTTRDTFELLQRAQAHGARVALFGRKIQQAESQRDLVRLMRLVLDGSLNPDQAVREYHEALAALGLDPVRSLTEDLAVTDPVMCAE